MVLPVFKQIRLHFVVTVHQVLREIYVKIVKRPIVFVNQILVLMEDHVFKLELRVLYVCVHRALLEVSVRLYSQQLLRQRVCSLRQLE